MMKILGMAMMLILGLGSPDDSNTRTISGTVYNEDDNLALAGATVSVKGGSAATTTDAQGRFTLTIRKQDKALVVTYLGFETLEVPLTQDNQYTIRLVPAAAELDEIVLLGYAQPQSDRAQVAVRHAGQPSLQMMTNFPLRPGQNTESYQSLAENKFYSPHDEPLSTFAVDVDGASYSNVRRFINGGQLPPADAVRIEEMINYFQYDLQAPRDREPVAIHTELAAAPWNPEHRLLRIGLKAKTVDADALPAANLVFLIDVSGSMAGSNRLPLVKAAMKMLVDQLRDQDRVAIVTYASTAMLKLDSTPATEKARIKDAIDELEASGSTAGGQGIGLAYKTARKHFIPKANNRVILASDGDFNVGPSSDTEMERLIERERQDGVSLSVFGFGMGNYKDSKLELLANKGHGNYAYIDNISEARKAMVTEFGGTLFTVAKDVKVQVEFNPAHVQAYRLIGYENRMLEAADFTNDHELGGDMGVGHVVTALYEVVPIGATGSLIGSVDPLKYQTPTARPNIKHSDELATVKFRYKEPDGDASKLKQAVVSNRALHLDQASDDFRFASAVAELGMLLRRSPYRQEANYERLIARARSAKGEDREGYRAAFVSMAENARLLAQTNDVMVPVQ